MCLQPLAEDVPEGDFPHHHGHGRWNHLHVSGEVDERVAANFLVECRNRGTYILESGQRERNGEIVSSNK